MIIAPDITHGFERLLTSGMIDADDLGTSDLSALRQGVSHLLQGIGHVFRKPILDGDHIGLPLVVEFRLVDGILNG